MSAGPDFREMTRTLYQAVSEAAGQRDWDAVRHHYHPEARLVRTGVNPDGTRFARVMSLYEFTWQSPTENRQGRGINLFTLIHAAGAGASSASSGTPSARA
jgi:hypothetical protein